MTREDENRRIAEWLEPMPSEPPKCHNDRSPLRMWLGINTGQFVWLLQPSLDFRTSEEGCALILEKLPEVILCRRLNPKDGTWYCQFNAGDIRTMQSATNHDRKSAIVEAALKLIAAGETK